MAAGTNYLIVGSDTRDGVDPSDPNAGAIIGGDEDTSGQRSDTMLLLRLEGDGAKLMSIPRDLWITRPDGNEGRINAVFRDGPGALVTAVRQNLGVPVHHYMEIDFVSFSGLVDALGGVTISVPNPAFDPKSGLNIPTAGEVELDGTQALAFVRSRTYTEIIDGQEQVDPTADLGRVQRQQQFLRAVMAEIGATRNPFAVAGMASAVADGVRLDDSMSFGDVIGLARRMRGLEPVSVELPVFGFSTSGGASVLGLAEGSDAALAEMGAGS
ncbi:MAG: LCP family protein [Actinomycetota bacterium]|nr:LCP family protein [Actinomycetota bacterium]